MQNVLINSQVRPILPGLMTHRFQDEIKAEPMLFNCDLHHAYNLGGQITREYIELLPEEWKEGPLVIDSRVHMLMPGWFPCIPGWHHDDVPRTRSDGQPNYWSDNRSRHIVAVVNADICSTQFALGESLFEEPELNTTIYQTWHRAVEHRLATGVLRPFSIPDSTLVEFDDRSWHQGTKAVASGWRFFIRASRYSDMGKRIDRGNKRTNEVRKQVQVYLDDPYKGW